MNVIFLFAMMSPRVQCHYSTVPRNYQPRRACGRIDRPPTNTAAAQVQKPNAICGTKAPAGAPTIDAAIRVLIPQMNSHGPIRSRKQMSRTMSTSLTRASICVFQLGLGQQKTISCCVSVLCDSTGDCATTQRW